MQGHLRCNVDGVYLKLSPARSLWASLSCLFISMKEIGHLQSPLCLCMCVSTTLLCSPGGFLLERIFLTKCVLPTKWKTKIFQCGLFCRCPVASQVLSALAFKELSYSVISIPRIWRGEISVSRWQSTHQAIKHALNHHRSIHTKHRQYIIVLIFCQRE